MYINVVFSGIVIILVWFVRILIMICYKFVYEFYYVVLKNNWRLEEEDFVISLSLI